MFDIVLSLLIEIILFVFFSIVGMAVIPQFDDEKDLIKNKISLFLLSPIVGFALWIGVSAFFAFLIKFNMTMIMIILFIFIALIIKCRQRLLYFREVFKIKKVFVCLSLMILFSLLLIYIIIPQVIDGGIYFCIGDYDHARVALVDSIVNNGLPIKTPFVTYNGNLVSSSYHLGIHIVMAQITLIFKVKSIVAKAVVYGLISVYTLLLCSCIIYKISNRKISFLFMTLLFLSHNDNGEITFIENINKSVFKNEALFGFWSILDTLIWTAHHILGAVVVLIIIYFYTNLVTRRSKNLMYYCLIGVLVSASCIISIYSGIFSLIIFLFIILFVYFYNKDFRNNFNKTFFYQIFAFVVALICVLPFLFSLIKYSNNEAKTILEMLKITLYKENLSNVFVSFFSFYFVKLPLRLGLVYVLGFIMIIYILIVMLKKKDLKENLYNFVLKNIFFKICVIYTIVSFAIVFVLKSDFYSNDFGWRIIAVPEVVLVCFATVLLTKIYDFLIQKNKIYFGLLAFVYLFISYCSIIGMRQDLLPQSKNSPELHKEFANAVKGWEVIKRNTKNDDIVACNPKAYRDLYNDPRMVFEEGANVNLFYAHYAGRNTLIADYNYSRSSAEKLLGQQYIKNLYDFTVRFFEGNPTEEDVKYLCDVQKVKAILVTPYDGLYNNEGCIMTKYPNKIEGIAYKVYFSEDVEIK